MTRRDRIMNALTPWFIGFTHPLGEVALVACIAVSAAAFGAVLAIIFI